MRGAPYDGTLEAKCQVRHDGLHRFHTWSTEAGGTYQLQWNSDLSSSNWTDLRGPVTAAGAALSVIDSVTNAPRRFYRLVLSP